MRRSYCYFRGNCLRLCPTVAGSRKRCIFTKQNGSAAGDKRGKLIIIKKKTTEVHLAPRGHLSLKRGTGSTGLAHPLAWCPLVVRWSPVLFREFAAFLRCTISVFAARG